MFITHREYQPGLLLLLTAAMFLYGVLLLVFPGFFERLASRSRFWAFDEPGRARLLNRVAAIGLIIGSGICLTVFLVRLGD